MTPEKLLRVLKPTYSRDFLQGLLCARAILLGQQPEQRSDAPPDFAAALEYVQGLVGQHGDREMVLLLIDDLLLRSYLESIGFG